MKAEIFSNRMWIADTDPLRTRIVIDEILKHHFKVLGYQDHFFPVQGWTATWMLGESHCAIHTFPEEGRSYLDVTSCNKDSQFWAMEKIRKYLTVIEEL